MSTTKASRVASGLERGRERIYVELKDYLTFYSENKDLNKDRDLVIQEIKAMTERIINRIQYPVY